MVLICLDRTHLIPLISKEPQRIINAYKSRGVTAVVNLSQRYSRAFIINPPTVHIKKINRVEGPRILKRSSCLFVSDLMPGWSRMRHTFWDDLHLEFESCSLKKKERLYMVQLVRLLSLISNWSIHLPLHLLWFQAIASNQCGSEKVNWPTWLSLRLFVYLINLLYKH